MAERILIVAPSWVGDAILSEPLVAVLREPFEEPIVDVLAPPWCAPVYARIDVVDASTHCHPLPGRRVRTREALADRAFHRARPAHARRGLRGMANGLAQRSADGGPDRSGGRGRARSHRPHRSR